MKEIPLSQGKVALVDDADFDWLNQWKWYAHCRRGCWYAARSVQENGRRRSLTMHETLGYAKHDHIDRNGLNNQRDNFRPCSASQNGINQKRRKDNTSGFKGVSWHKPSRSWQARLRQKVLGFFSDAESAARAYNEAAFREFGEFAVLNVL